MVSGGKFVKLTARDGRWRRSFSGQSYSRVRPHLGVVWLDDACHPVGIGPRLAALDIEFLPGKMSDQSK